MFAATTNMFIAIACLVHRQSLQSCMFTLIAYMFITLAYMPTATINRFPAIGNMFTASMFHWHT
jgi:hypothetical protein